MFYGFGESIQNEALVLAGLRMQLVSEELDNMRIFDLSRLLVFRLFYFVEELLGILCPPIILLLILGICSPRQRLLSKVNHDNK
jgi:hypothetical protein